MNSDYDYQLPWRTNFEAWAIVGWLSSIGLALLSFRLSGLPSELFLYLAGFCSFMALWRLPLAGGSSGHQPYCGTFGSYLVNS